MSDHIKSKRPSIINLTKKKTDVESASPVVERTVTNYNNTKEKKNFLLDYVFENKNERRKKGFKIYSERVGMNIKKLTENNKLNDPKHIDANFNNGGGIRGTYITAYDSLSSKECQKNKTNIIKLNNNQNNINQLPSSIFNSPSSNFQQNKMTINNFNNVKGNISPTNCLKNIPDIKKIINKKSSNFNCQFINLSKQIKDKKGFRNFSDPASITVEDNGDSRTNNENLININTSISQNINNLKKRNSNYESPLAMSQLKSIVLSSTMSSNQPNYNRAYSNNKDSEKGKDNINFYEVNIGKYLNFNKDNATYLDLKSFNSNSVMNMNNSSELDSMSPKNENKQFNKVFKKMSDNNSQFKSSFTKFSLKNSFSNLINTNNVESPEELHLASVLFYINNKNVSKKFDRDLSEEKLVKVIQKKSNFKSVKILSHEVEL